MCMIDVLALSQAVGLDTVPGLSAPETVLKELGANYSKAPSDWGSHVEVDTSGSGPLVTGLSLSCASPPEQCCAVLAVPIGGTGHAMRGCGHAWKHQLKSWLASAAKWSYRLVCCNGRLNLDRMQQP